MQNQAQYLLVVTKGPNVGEAYSLPDAPCTVGRTADNNIVIDSTRISRHHAKLTPGPQGVVIEDLNSTNGSFINDKLLTAPYTLSDGDIITFADYLSLRFELNTAALPTENMTPVPPNTTTQTRHAGQTPLPPTMQPDHAESTNIPSPMVTKERALSIESVEAQRARWPYTLIIVLVVLILLCLAFAAYLWFAPYEFWVKVFELFNIPLP